MTNEPKKKPEKKSLGEKIYSDSRHYDPDFMWSLASMELSEVGGLSDIAKEQLERARKRRQESSLREGSIDSVGR